MEHIANLRRMGLFDARVPRYTSYPPATAFNPQVGADFQRDCLMGLDPTVPVSVYIHIPFCERLCWFCACATQGTTTLKPVENYLRVLKLELALLARSLPAGVTMGQMHWGGGTPTILPPDMIRDLARAVMAVIPPAADFSFSVEIDRKHSPRAVWRSVVVIVYRVSLWTHTRTPPACKFYRFPTRVVVAVGRMMRRSGSSRKALATA